MTLQIDHRKPSTLNDAVQRIAPAEAAAILSSASDLLAVAAHGQTNAALKGKQLGLMCARDSPPKLDKPDGNELKNRNDEGESGDAAFFRFAATRLGARVARIRPGLSAGCSGTELRRLALMLGRLYDAVECQGLSFDLVQKIRAQAGVPVYFGLASAGHPTADLVAHLVGSASSSDKRLFVLQAALLHSLIQAEADV